MDEIALFELDGHDDIGGRHEREDQMRNSHRGRRPECQKESKV